MPKLFKKGKLNLSFISDKLSVNQFFLISFDNLSKIAFKIAYLSFFQKNSDALTYSLITTFFGVLCLKISSKTAENKIIFNNLSVFSKFISLSNCFIIVSSINSFLSSVPQ